MSRVYPLPSGATVPMGLVFSVARLLRERGYPPVEDGSDLAALHDALDAFVYGRAPVSVPAGSLVAGEPTATHGALQHPTWCDPQHCAANDREVAHHRGTPVTIAARLPGQPTITAQVWQVADEPLDTAPVSLMLTIDDSMLSRSIHGYDLEAWQAAALVDELGPLVALIRPHAGGVR